MDKIQRVLDFSNMRLIDTTDPGAHGTSLTLVSSVGAERECHLAGRFRIHLLGMYHAEVGEAWDSNGDRQGDFLNHIDITLSGRRQVVCNGRVHDMSAGQVWFLPGNTPVERRHVENAEVLYFKFNCEWLPGVDPLLDWPGREPRLAGEIDVNEWRKWADGRKIGVSDLLWLRGMLLSWMAGAVPELDAVISKHLATHKQFTRVFDTIERELGADLRMSEVARSHGTGVEAFSMAFSRATGMSPKDYVTRRLNQEALQLVINTDLKMKEIADRLRFTDEFYFSRFFKKLNGCPPSAYRQRTRGLRAG